MNETSPPSSSKAQHTSSSFPPHNYRPHHIAEDEISLLDLWHVIVRYKTMVIGITLVATFSATAIAFLMTPIYRAETLLAPVSDEEQTAMSAMVGQFGGLASLAGINLGSKGNNTDKVIATLTSRSFIGNFIMDKQLMPVLFADDWDSATKTWKDKSPDDIPTVLDAFKLFHEDFIYVATDKKTGLVTVSVEWKDPKQAATWANELVNRINQHEKQLAINEAEKSISYLNEQLAKTSVVEMQQAIYQLMEAETKKIMLANVRDQYAFKILDPAVAPEEPAKPMRSLIVAIGMVVGLMLSIFLAFLRYSINDEHK